MSVMIFENNQRQILSFNDLGTTTPFINYAKGCANTNLGQYQTLASQIIDLPNYSATVDVNSDCRADLMILSL